jgi:hypothetical protein
VQNEAGEKPKEDDQQQVSCVSISLSANNTIKIEIMPHIYILVLVLRVLRLKIPYCKTNILLTFDFANICYVPESVLTQKKFRKITGNV